jgi:hypothetical protein
VDKVRVRALIDSGSMKSFVSKSVQRTIDFDETKSKKDNCVSITGHTVNIQGNLPLTVQFVGSRVYFKGDFLVNNNIPYDLWLGFHQPK